MQKKYLPSLLAFILLSSCSPRTSTALLTSHESLNYDEEVVVIALDESIPEDSEVLGQVKVRDTGFSTKCNYSIVLDKAKLEARKAGGNAIKITRHKKPDLWSTCHRLDATILKI